MCYPDKQGKHAQILFSGLQVLIIFIIELSLNHSFDQLIYRLGYKMLENSDITIPESPRRHLQITCFVRPTAQN